MGTVRFTTTPFGSGRSSAPLSIPVLLDRQAKLMTKAGRAKTFHIRFGREDLFGRGRTFSEVQDRSKQLMNENHPNGLLYTLGVADSPKEGDAVRAIEKVHRVEVGPKPMNTTGVASIDLIYGAVFEKFNDKYGILNLGICADKPGEHSKCNAWDIGVAKPRTADAIHSAILEIANYLRTAMIADMSGESAATPLPVNGVIVMEQICERSNTSWHYYDGIAHVSHVHVSGWPNLVPGWV